MDFFSGRSLKQQSTDGHVALLRYITMIPSQPFQLSTHTNFIVFGLAWLGLKPTIYRTRGEHAKHYNTDSTTLEVSTLNIRTQILPHSRWAR